MKQFLKKILIIVTSIFIIQYFLGYTLHHRRNKLLEEVYFPIKRWKEFYSQPNNSVDLVFVGSSHCYRSLIPHVFDTILNVNSFNLGSSGQLVSTSYYIIEEMLRTQSPSTIIIELYYGNLKERTNSNDVIHNFPQMQSCIKYKMLQSVSIQNAMKMALLPLKTVAINKTQLLNLSREIPDTTTEFYSLYDHKGFVATYAEPSFKYEYNDSIVILKKLSKIQTNYFDKIVDLCKSQNINLIAVTQPIHPGYKCKTTNHDIIYKQIEELCQKKQIPYYDFNKIIQLNPKYFYDKGHLLHKGSKSFSQAVANQAHQLLSN